MVNRPGLRRIGIGGGTCAKSTALSAILSSNKAAHSCGVWMIYANAISSVLGKSIEILCPDTTQND
jgi:hypothetical protein